MLDGVRDELPRVGTRWSVFACVIGNEELCTLLQRDNGAAIALIILLSLIRKDVELGTDLL